MYNLNKLNIMTNLVEITRFEAYALYNHYRQKAIESQVQGLLTLVDSFNQKSSHWLDVACDIEEKNADGINESLNLIDLKKLYKL